MSCDSIFIQSNVNFITNHLHNLIAEEFIIFQRMKEEAVSEFIVRVRGLPFKVSEEDVRGFFSSVNIVEVHFPKNREGRPSGDAYLELGTLKDQKEAGKYNQEYMGDRPGGVRGQAE